MAAPAANMIPEGAFQASEEASKTRDYYSNLSDEEREAEGLPARERPADPPPPEPEPADTDPDEDDDQDEEVPEDSATAALFDEISSLRQDLGLGEPGEKPEASEDALVQAARDHEDPVVRGMAKRMEEAEAELASLRAAARDQVIGQQLAQDDADFDAVQAGYLIGGKPMTDKHVQMVENYLLRNKQVAMHLSIEEATRRVFPNAERAGTRTSPNGRPVNSGRTAGAGEPTATIVDVGTSGGAPEGPWKPRMGESVESAVAAAGARLFGVKR